MNRTLDPITASEPELFAWLAAQPCPESCTLVGGKYKRIGQNWDSGSLIEYDAGLCGPCGGTGLAFEWASEVCPYSWHRGGQPQPSLVEDNCVAGRVPKDVGLAELLKRTPMRLYPPGDDDSIMFGEEQWTWKAVVQDYYTHPIICAEAEIPTLAALRAVAKAAVEQ